MHTDIHIRCIRILRSTVVQLKQTNKHTKNFKSNNAEQKWIALMLIYPSVDRRPTGYRSGHWGRPPSSSSLSQPHIKKTKGVQAFCYCQSLWNSLQLHKVHKDSPIAVYFESSLRCLIIFLKLSIVSTDFLFTVFF